MMIRQSILQGAQFKVKTADHVYAGVMHILILWGFMVLMFGEIEIALSVFIPNFNFSFLGPFIRSIFFFKICSYFLCHCYDYGVCKAFCMASSTDQLSSRIIFYSCGDYNFNDYASRYEY